MPTSSFFISVVIATYNGAGFLEQCVRSVFNTDYPDFELIVVDNASTDGSVEKLYGEFGAEARLRIVRNEKNLLFTGGYNAGFRAARGAIIVALNNDTEVDPGWLAAIASAMRDESIGAAQAQVLLWGSDPPVIDYAGATIDRFGFSLGYGAGEKYRRGSPLPRDIFYAGGTVFIIRRDVMDITGLFDDTFGMHWEDVDLSWRVHLAGFRVVLIPGALIYHKGSLSMKKFARSAAVVWYVRKNRLAGLIKNYSLWNVIIIVPCTIAAYLVCALKELLIDRNPSFASSTFCAIIWNIKLLPHVLTERRRVQRMRRVPDKDIVKLMCPRPVFTSSRRSA